MPHAYVHLSVPRVLTCGLLDPTIGLECSGGLQQLLHPLYDQQIHSVGKIPRKKPDMASMWLFYYATNLHMGVRSSTTPHTRGANWSNSGSAQRYSAAGQLATTACCTQHVSHNIGQAIGLERLSTGLLIAIDILQTSDASNVLGRIEFTALSTRDRVDT